MKKARSDETFFDQRRSLILASLYGDQENGQVYTDKSLKGSIDEPLKPLINLINQNSNLVSTSCCSGRIAVFASDASGRKNAGRFLYINHGLYNNSTTNLSTMRCETSSANALEAEPVGFCVTENDVSSFFSMLADQHQREHDATVYGQRPKTQFDQLSANISEIWLNVEPFVVHIACRDLETASLLTKAVLQAGIKQFGLRGVPPQRLIFALRGTHVMRVPIGEIVEGKLEFYVDFQYAARLLTIANQKMHRNWLQLQRFQKTLEALTASTPSLSHLPQRARYCSLSAKKTNNIPFSTEKLDHYDCSFTPPSFVTREAGPLLVTSSKDFFVFVTPPEQLAKSHRLCLFHPITNCWIVPHLRFSAEQFMMHSGKLELGTLDAVSNLFFLVALPQNGLPARIAVFRFVHNERDQSFWRELAVSVGVQTLDLDPLETYGLHAQPTSGTTAVIKLFVGQVHRLLIPSNSSLQPKSDVTSVSIWELRLSIAGGCDQSPLCWEQLPFVSQIPSNNGKNALETDDKELRAEKKLKIWKEDASMRAIRFSSDGLYRPSDLNICWIYRPYLRGWRFLPISTTELPSHDCCQSTLSFLSLQNQLIVALFSKRESPTAATYWALQPNSNFSQAVQWQEPANAPYCWVKWSPPWSVPCSLATVVSPLTVVLGIMSNTARCAPTFWVPVSSKRYIRPVKTACEALGLFDRRRKIRSGVDVMTLPTTNFTPEALIPVVRQVSLDDIKALLRVEPSNGCLLPLLNCTVTLPDPR